MLPVGYMRSFFLETRSNAASALPASQTTIESKNWRNYIRKQRKANRGGTTLHAMYVPSRLGGKMAGGEVQATGRKGFIILHHHGHLSPYFFDETELIGGMGCAIHH